MTEKKQKAAHFKLDLDVADGLKAYAENKYRGNKTLAVNEILRDKFKRCKR